MPRRSLVGKSPAEYYRTIPSNVGASAPLPRAASTSPYQRTTGWDIRPITLSIIIHCRLTRGFLWVLTPHPSSRLCSSVVAGLPQSPLHAH